MIIPLTASLHVDGFVMMLGDLMQLSGKDFETVLVNQCAALIRFCVKNAPVAKRENIILKQLGVRKEYYEFPSGQVIYHSKKFGGSWLFLDQSTWKDGKGKKPPVSLDGGKSFHDMTHWHWSDERWSEYEALCDQIDQIEKARRNVRKLPADVQAAIRSIGVTKRSWYQIAEALKVQALVEVPNYVKTATPSNGRVYQNGTARSMLDHAAAFIELSNDNPIAVKMGGQSMINYAVAARVKAFEREVEKRVFDDMKTRAQRYPGLFVSES